MPLRGKLQTEINAVADEARLGGLSKAQLNGKLNRMETAVKTAMQEAGFSASYRANPNNLKVTQDAHGRLCVEVSEPGRRQCIVLNSLPSDQWKAALDD